MNKQQGLKKRKGYICVVIQNPDCVFNYSSDQILDPQHSRAVKVHQQPHNQLFEAASVVSIKVM